VVAATGDPDPRVAGRGLALLAAAGIETACGLMEAEARALNAGFIGRIERGRPLVALKFASTLDGRIATRTGASQWITGPEARAHGHLLRAEHDAIMVGRGTVRADDPVLTCRLPGLERRSPVRVVIDGKLELPLASRLVRSARDVPVWCLTAADVGGERRQALQAAGVELIDVAPAAGGHVELAAALAALGQRGITRLLVEAGEGLAAALLREGLVDRAYWYRAGRVAGADGLAALGPLGLDRVDDMPRWRLEEVRRIGADLLETYAVRT
jgi:diaminohydroxyphosphoribosylaminopyrimidine deaminase/5-amino-6-(5-phosphoribosylamino)uracil reductase